MRQAFDAGIDAGRHIFGVASASQKSRIGVWAFYAVTGFLFLHILNWSAKCGPLAAGKFDDYCAELDKTRGAKPLIVNQATYARARASNHSPYVDLKEPGEVLEEFLPPGYGRSKINANVREGPGMNYEVFESLEKDSVVEIIEEENGWIKVRLPGSSLDAEHFGWVWRDLLIR